MCAVHGNTISFFRHFTQTTDSFCDPTRHNSENHNMILQAQEYLKSYIKQVMLT